MAIHFRCTKCSHTLQVPDEHAGHKAKCPNCGQILPIPSKADSQPKAKPAPQIPGLSATAGPIPSLVAKSKPSSARQTKPSPSSSKPPELRSGKRAVIFGVVLVVLLIIAVLGWQRGWYGGRAKKPPVRARRTGKSSVSKTATTAQPKISAEMLAQGTAKMELQLAGLEKLLDAQPDAPGLDQKLIAAFTALQDLAQQARSGSAESGNLNLQLARNREWLYQQTHFRAQSLLGQYRFKSAQDLLQQSLATQPAVAASPTVRTRTSRRSSHRSKSTRTSVQPIYRQACANLARDERVKRGLEGEICLYLAQVADQLGSKQTSITLDPPANYSPSRKTTRTGRNNRRPPAVPSGGPPMPYGSNPYQAARTQPTPPLPGRRTSSARRSTGDTSPPRVTYHPQWGSASKHLDFIRKLQIQAEGRSDPARAGRFYALARDLESRCMTFETPGPDDAKLIKRLAGRKTDRQVQQQIHNLIARCRYRQALKLAENLVRDKPDNPDNHHWLLRCQMESHNGQTLRIDSSALTSLADKAAAISRYDLPNNLLAISLHSLAQPTGLGMTRFGQFVQQRNSQLKALAKYADKYTPVVNWLQGESRDMVLQDFKCSPFLAGDPLDLLDRQGVLYTLYSRSAPPGRAALLLARVPQGKNGPSLHLQLPAAGRYKLVNLRLPDNLPDSSAVTSRTRIKPIIETVLSLAQIKPSDIARKSTIPVLTSLESLRCEPAGSRSAGWVLRIARTAMAKEQLSAPSEARSRSPQSRGAAYGSPPRGATYGPGRATTRPASRTSRDQDRYLRINFVASGRGSRSRYGSRSTVAAGPSARSITCLVPDHGSAITYFTDANAKYLLGPDGQRLYLDEQDLLLSSRPTDAPAQCIALDLRALPPELQQRIDKNSQLSAPEKSPYAAAGDTYRPPGQSPANGSTSARTNAGQVVRSGPLKIAEAAAWLSRLLDQQKTSFSRSYPVRPYSRRPGKSISPPPVARWLEFQGRIIAQVQGRIVQLPQDKYSEPIFYTPEAAAKLLTDADDYYRASLDAWPTLAGEVYRAINNRRMLRLIGLPGSASGPGRHKDRLAELDLNQELDRARNRLQSGDLNQALAILADLTAAFSLQLQQAIEQDSHTFSLLEIWKTASTTSSGQPSLFSDDQKPLAAQPMYGQGYGGDRTTIRTSPRPIWQDSSYLPGELLLAVNINRADAFTQAGLLRQARQSLRQGRLRLSGYLLADLNEQIRYLQAQDKPVPPKMEVVKKRWQEIVSPKNSVRQGSVAFAPASQESPEPPMSLATWLAAQEADLEKLPGERLVLARQFDWLRSSMPQEAEPADQLSSDQRAEKIMALAQAYQASRRADPATALALWELGSYLASMECRAEAWETLAQAAAVYSQLAADLLQGPGPAESELAARIQSYYSYRVAALAAVGEAAAMPETQPSCPQGRVLLLGEVQAKLDQISRQWAKAGLEQGSFAALLGNSTHTLTLVGNLALSQAYEHPRIRFWWWYYPQTSSQASATRATSSRGGRDRSSTRLVRPKARPTLEYIRGHKLSPQTAPPMLPTTPASRYGI